MKCRKTARLVSLLIDKEIKPADKKKLDEHLLRCESCAALLDEWKQTWNHLNLPVLAVNPYFYTRIRSELDSLRTEKKMDLMPNWVKAGFAAALLVGGMLGHFTAAFNSQDVSGISAINGEWDPYSVYANQSVGDTYLDIAINYNGE